VGTEVPEGVFPLAKGRNFTRQAPPGPWQALGLGWP
jgi:hypothetical protein